MTRERGRIEPSVSSSANAPKCSFGLSGAACKMMCMCSEADSVVSSHLVLVLPPDSLGLSLASRSVAPPTNNTAEMRG